LRRQTGVWKSCRSERTWPWYRNDVGTMYRDPEGTKKRCTCDRAMLCCKACSETCSQMRNRRCDMEYLNSCTRSPSTSKSQTCSHSFALAALLSDSPLHRRMQCLCTGQGKHTRTYAPTHGLVHATSLLLCPINGDRRDIGHPRTSHSNTFNC
jgi:hypothetical protein